MSARWTPEMRAAQGRVIRARYAAWSTEYPDRAAVVAALWQAVKAGGLERPACADCARPMNPVYDWEAMAAIEWRCRSHPDHEPIR